MKLNPLLAEWIKTRPAEVRALAAEFPLGTLIPIALTAKHGGTKQFIMPRSTAAKYMSGAIGAGITLFKRSVPWNDMPSTKTTKTAHGPPSSRAMSWTVAARFSMRV